MEALLIHIETKSSCQRLCPSLIFHLVMSRNSHDDCSRKLACDLSLSCLFPETACLSESVKKPENGTAEGKVDLAKLDLQLTYLWRVHGIDHYTGKEFAEPAQFKLRSDTTRTLRGPRPEEGEKASEAEGL